jgi:hypothetical protein
MPQISGEIGLVVLASDEFDRWPESRVETCASSPLDKGRDQLGPGGAGEPQYGGEVAVLGVSVGPRPAPEARAI